MPTDEHSKDGIESLVRGIYSYLQEVDGYRTVCSRHADTAAIHSTKSQQLEVYRLFDRNADTAKSLRSSTESLPSWDQSPFWKANADSLNKLERDVNSRITKHKKLHPIVTRGISWQSKPILIHAYKFEPDPVMKVELVAPQIEHAQSELPLATMAKILECHEYLVPEFTAKPLPPYHRHETQLQTIWEYLSQTMPNNLYATQCFPHPTQK